jgi:hypothetical protein
VALFRLRIDLKQIKYVVTHAGSDYSSSDEDWVKVPDGDDSSFYS